MNTNSRKRVYLYYTIAFIICCLTCFYIYYSSGKTFIYDKDGYQQYLKALIYYSDLIRQFFKNLFINHKFIIPQYSFSIGEGADILSTFQCYVMGDPISFLCFLFSAENMYIFYNIGVILRLYLSGIAFIILCLYLKKDNTYAIVAGSIVYTFCFWNIFNATTHFHFINLVILYPMVILGIEKIINNDKPYVLTIWVFISCLSSIYFLCLIVIMTVIYVVVRLLCLYKKDFKSILKKVLIIFKYSLLGVVMAAVVVIPMMYALTDDFRVSIDTNIHLLYPLDYYKKLPAMFFSVSRNYWLCMGFASPVILAMVIAVLKLKKNSFLAICNILCVFFIVSPLFGQATNGFRYITNRWSFSMALLVSYDLVNEWDVLSDYKFILTIFTVLITVGLTVLGANVNIIVPLGLCLIFVAVLWTKDIVFKSFRIKQVLMIAIIVISVSFTANWYYLPVGANYANRAISNIDASTIVEDGTANCIKNNVFDDSFYRFSGSDLVVNSSLLSGTHSTDYYWSLSNKYISRFRNDISISEYSLMNYREYSKRSGLLTLANVKYYIMPKNDSSIVPYGFSMYKETDDNLIYINDNYLPFGYTYKHVMSYENWLELNSLDKEYAMLSNVVIDGECKDSSFFKPISKNIEYEIKAEDGIKIENNTFVVENTNSKVHIQFDALDDCCLYIDIIGLNYSDGKSWLNNPISSISIDISNADGIIDTISYANEDDKYQYGRDSFVSYLGFNQKTNDIYISFSNIGKYHFDDIAIIGTPMEEYSNNIADLSNDCLKNIVFDNNKVSGNITIDESKTLLLSIPYSKYWTAKVDDEKANVLIGNGRYIAINLNEGSHTIELKYDNKLMDYGAIISILGVCYFVFDLFKKSIIKYK